MRSLLITDLQGSQDAVLGFRFCGILAVQVNSPEDTLAALDKALADRDIGLVLLTERLASACYAEVMARRLAEQRTMVLIIPDPGQPFSDHIATYVRDAIGIRF